MSDATQMRKRSLMARSDTSGHYGARNERYPLEPRVFVGLLATESLRNSFLSGSPFCRLFLHVEYRAKEHDCEISPEPCSRYTTTKPEIDLGFHYRHNQHYAAHRSPICFPWYSKGLRQPNRKSRNRIRPSAFSIAGQDVSYDYVGEFSLLSVHLSTY